ncbi:Fanconi anemia group J protein [Carex littledalei]|uniref:Regulator of telomere elongation helicase 1 homolog n=1 Tax=Carex littledalei TaxID=544730 RepID=A0A833QSB5_9POAL|nr:Fanconi anemia group J protein [Carex littledalei]
MEPTTPLPIPTNTALSSPSPTPTSNPSRDGSKRNTYQIGGVPVEFPYKPYGSQLAFMGRVIATLDRARRQGHCHALLESPTGTGKSLSLLCSALAWQQHYKSRPLPSQPQVTDPLLHGGGFIPEPEPEPSKPSTPATTAKGQKKKLAPVIFYASRTHSQISQVIREFRKTTYRVPMAILASRKHYCTNKHVCMSENIDETCKTLLKDEGLGCLEFKNANKVKSHPSLQKGGCNEVHDIEDLVKVGRSVKGCAYFAAQTMAEEAQVVFCPYSYVINPVVRRAMDVDIKGSILIIDEAHNMEDMARDGGSVNVDEEVLSGKWFLSILVTLLQTELGQLCTDESIAMTYQPLHDVIQGLISWISQRKDNLQKREFEHHSSCWTGDKAVRELQNAGITQQCFPILQECASKAVKAAADSESNGVYLSGISVATLEGIFSSLSYFYSENGCHTSDYQLALQKYIERDPKNATFGWKCSFSLWCLNPAVVFRGIANLSLSVILTSGTLSPMGSFASELGVQFETIMEAPHVIDIESQLWTSVIPWGPANCPLNASYKTADSYAFQDALGISLEEICKVVPGGALVFFPSYKLLDKLQMRWSQTGQWSRLNAKKPVFVEPRGSAEDFESAMKGYYDAIAGKTKPSSRKTGRKQITKNRAIKDSAHAIQNGATFLAVCRGKVSEGIDFSDENARVVVIVGIPFPNINDVQVVLKKRYNDTYKSSKGLLSGSEWYCYQAFRALNQAAGRCIRHRSDYGAIIFLDERFKEERNLMYISKWLKSSIKNFGSFEESLEGLQSFFQNVEAKIKRENNDQDIDVIAEIDPLDSNCDRRKLPWDKLNLSDKATPEKKNKKSRKSSMTQNCTQIIFIDPLERPPLSLANSTVAGEHLFRNYQSSAKAEMISPDESRKLKTSILSWENNLPLQKRLDEPQPKPNKPNQFQNGNLAICNSVSIVTPEKASFIDLSNSDEELNFNHSAKSSQKRRKMVNSQLAGCTMYSEQYTPQNCTSNYTKDGNKVNVLGVKLRELVQSSLVIETNKNLKICCKLCKTQLGLAENNLVVLCTHSKMSKVYFAHMLKQGDESVGLKHMLVETIVCDMSLINEELVKENKNPGVWSEEDGCVFREVNCLFCPSGKVHLGVQVLAANASNVHLINKVELLKCDDGTCLYSTQEKESFKCKHQPHDAGLLNSEKAKVGFTISGLAAAELRSTVFLGASALRPLLPENMSL